MCNSFLCIRCFDMFVYLSNSLLLSCTYQQTHIITGVLYATILALTLGVLYNRFTRIQENVTTEATLLSSLTRNLLCLFQDEPRWATDACQMIANQLRIMLSRTRGVELLSIMKADTYSNNWHWSMIIIIYTGAMRSLMPRKRVPWGI